MWPIATDITHNVFCVSTVWVLGTWVRSAKTAELMNMQFGAESCEPNEPCIR